MLVNAELEGLVELGYPKDILEIDLDRDLPLCLNASIFDMDNSLIIKIGAGKEVLKAMRGFKTLSREEIEEVYGSPPIFKSY